MALSAEDRMAFRARRAETLKLLSSTIWDAALLVPEAELKEFVRQELIRAYRALSS